MVRNFKTKLKIIGSVYKVFTKNSIFSKGLTHGFWENFKKYDYIVLMHPAVPYDDVQRGLESLLSLFFFKKIIILF